MFFIASNNSRSSFPIGPNFFYLPSTRLNWKINPFISESKEKRKRKPKLLWRTTYRDSLTIQADGGGEVVYACNGWVFGEEEEEFFSFFCITWPKWRHFELGELKMSAARSRWKRFEAKFTGWKGKRIRPFRQGNCLGCQWECAYNPSEKSNILLGRINNLWFFAALVCQFTATVRKQLLACMHNPAVCLPTAKLRQHWHACKSKTLYQTYSGYNLIRTVAYFILCIYASRIHINMSFDVTWYQMSQI